MTSLRVTSEDLSNVPGPSPWYYRQDELAFPSFPSALRWHHPSQEPLLGKTLLVTPEGGVVLMLDCQCYVVPLGAPHVLVWHQGKSGAVPAGAVADVYLHVFDVSRLAPLADVAFAARQLPDVVSVWSTTPPIAQVQIPATLAAGVHPCPMPAPLLARDEIFLLVAPFHIGTPEGAAVFAWIVRPAAGTIEVLPQDWFLERDLDYGYQWITRLARDSRTGRIIGDGIRISPFVLDQTGRQVLWADWPEFNDR
jgi:hypothetical protein